jgi:hypothetical protein
MIAKQLDNISVGSLLKSGLIVLLLANLIWWWPHASWQYSFWPSFIANSITAQKLIALVLITGSAVVFTETLNRQRVFDGHYNFSITSVAFIFMLLLNQGSAEDLVWLPVLLLFVHRAQDLVTSARPILHISFDLGFIIGAMAWVNGYANLILVLVWVMGLVSGTFSFRFVAANLMGYGAPLFLVATVRLALGYNMFEPFYLALQQVEFSPIYQSHWDLIQYLLYGLSLLLSPLLLPLIKSKINNYQRQNLQLWFVMMLFALVGVLLFESRSFWLGLSLWPVSWVFAQILNQLKNKWLKNGLFMLICLAPPALLWIQLF